MNADLLRRLKSLEALPRLCGNLPLCPDGLERRGRSLFVPPTPTTPEEIATWERECAEQQRELAEGDTRHE
jgi:hypothetical protein